MAVRFRDRRDAGRRLVAGLGGYSRRSDVLVLALPRGGVPVAYEVARALHAPLDVFLVRKLGMPGHEEFAIGAIASGGVRILNDETLDAYGVSAEQVSAVVDAEERELARRAEQYRGGRAFPDVSGRTVILIDDGLATGSTMRAAVAALRVEGPARIVVAVPTAPPETCAELRSIAEDVVCLMTPEPFYAVGLWYEDFAQTTDEEVRELLEQAANSLAASDTSVPTGSSPATGMQAMIGVPADGATLEGDLAVPFEASGVVVFAHGSGSSRHSSRNQFVARRLRGLGLGTLLIDLLTAEEERVDAVTSGHRFDIPLLAARVAAAIAWLGERAETRALRVGVFGASTGGGAALVAAARDPSRVRAVVSRGGRPDLAGDALPRVQAPTLLIVGEADEPVLALNERAMAQMQSEVRLEVVSGASHLFEEPGTLDRVAELAGAWFQRHL